MISAQESPVGVPKELLEAKKLELQQQQVQQKQVCPFHAMRVYHSTNSSSRPPELLLIVAVSSMIRRI